MYGHEWSNIMILNSPNVAYRIGLVGSPGSGKTVLAAKLYARLLEEGIYSTRLVSEYAHEYLGMKRKLNCIQDQTKVTKTQISREMDAIKCSFSPIICDSAVFVAKTYLEYRWSKGEYSEHEKSLLRNVSKMEISESFISLCADIERVSNYSMLIYVPLIDLTNKENLYRIQNAQQSLEISNMMLNDLSNRKNVVYCPTNIEDRDSFITSIVSKIIQKDDIRNR